MEWYGTIEVPCPAWHLQAPLLANSSAALALQTLQTPGVMKLQLQEGWQAGHGKAEAPHIKVPNTRIIKVARLSTGFSSKFTSW